MLLLFPTVLSGCGKQSSSSAPQESYDIDKRLPLNEGEQVYSFPESATYQNPLEVNGQWGGVGKDRYYYGIGDPFVMRFNGKYYLYPSTQGPNKGVKVYESTDMITWEYKGFAVPNTDATTENAYAPEVIYYQGSFYMCQSKGGSGHYFYKADNPLGPFNRITGNLGRGIDGSFHVNDDGSIYLIHTNVPAGLRMSQIIDFEAGDDSQVLKPQVLVEEANLNHWIEGPNTIRRDDVTFLTYTGNHVSSKGYRVAYSYTEGNSFSARDFKQHLNNVTLISTKDGYKALGHSSDFFGPDLDSIYTGYHNNDSYGRRYNLDRYLTNGNILLSSGALNHNVNKALLPTFEALNKEDLSLNGNFYLSDIGTGKYYTADLNFIPQGGYVVLDYEDSNNYLKLTITNKVTLSQIKNGQESEIVSQSFGSEIDINKLINVRVEKDLSKFRIYLNEMKKLEVTLSSSGGLLGYHNSSDIYYTAFTNEVNGSSDFEAIRYLPSSFPAHTYLKQENRGFYFSGETLNNVVRLGEKNNIIKENNQYSVVLDKKDDFVKYPLKAEKDNYALVLQLNKVSKGAVFEVIINDNLIIPLTVPTDIDFKDADYLPVYLTNLDLQGDISLKIRLFSGVLKFKQIDIYEDADYQELDLSGNELLEALKSDGAGNYTLDNENVVSDDGHIFMGLLGQDGVTNFEYEVDVAFLNGTSQDGGIVFRAKNYSYHKDQPLQSFQGYFFQIKQSVGTLFRYDYGATVLKVVSLTDKEHNPLFTSQQVHHFKVIVYQNNYKIYLDDICIIDFYDSQQFMNGKVGFYSNNSAYSYANVIYKKI
ncbi:MAG: family 43 glycosylhydrolase [Bacillales bacterium]|nr:family 43 glycosylhydrolase [Bacillales bacterium]